MSARKCNCKKCEYCKQVCTETAISRTNCKVYGEIYKPIYCDKFITIKEYKIFKNYVPQNKR